MFIVSNTANGDLRVERKAQNVVQLLAKNDEYKAWAISLGEDGVPVIGGAVNLRNAVSVAEIYEYDLVDLGSDEVIGKGKVQQ